MVRFMQSKYIGCMLVLVLISSSVLVGAASGSQVRAAFDISIGPVMVSDGVPAVNATIIVEGGSPEGYKTNSTGMAVVSLDPGTYRCKVLYESKEIPFVLHVSDNGSAEYYIPYLEEYNRVLKVWVGPVTAEDGDILKDVKVTIYYDGSTYVGITGENGSACIILPVSAAGRDVRVVLEKDGFLSASFTTGIHANGLLTSEPPHMRHANEGEEYEHSESQSGAVLGIVLAVIFIIAVYFILGRRKN